jgi:hypothetical protein
MIKSQVAVFKPSCGLENRRQVQPLEYFPQGYKKACANQNQQVAATVASMFVSVAGITDQIDLRLAVAFLQRTRQQRLGR